MNPDIANDREYIRRKKRIEYKHAEPYLTPVADPSRQSEAGLRKRVRTALAELPRREQLELRNELRHAYDMTH